MLTATANKGGTKVPLESPIKWPNLDKDQRAWELAKIALGPDADIHQLIDRANQIKETL